MRSNRQIQWETARSSTIGDFQITVARWDRYHQCAKEGFSSISQLIAKLMALSPLGWRLQLRHIQFHQLATGNYLLASRFVEFDMSHFPDTSKRNLKN